MAADPFGLDPNPARGGYAITPHDTVNFAVPFRAIYVGGAGNIVVVGRDGAAYTLVGALAGVVYSVAGVRVNNTDTTATNLVGLT